MTYAHRISSGLLLVAASMWTALAATLLLTLAYWWIEPAPFDPPTNMQIVGPTVLRVTDALQLQRDICVRRAGVPLIRSVRWYLQGDGVYQAPPQRVVTEEPGCRRFHVAWAIPNDLPPGHYRVVSEWTGQINPLRSVVIPGGSVEVDIVP